MVSAGMVLLAVAIVGAGDVPAGAEPVPYTGTHGMFIVKGCSIPYGCVPFTPYCNSSTVYYDAFGDAIVITEAFDIVEPDGMALRVPAEGSLPIEDLLGNAVAIGPPTPESPLGTLPVLIGPPGSTYESPSFPGHPLPGALDNGVLRVRSNQYEVEGPEPQFIPIMTKMRWKDECDSGAPDCDPYTLHSSEASSLITVLAPTVDLWSSVSVEHVCFGAPTVVTLDYVVTAAAGNADLADVQVIDEACGPLAGPFGDVGGPDNEGDGVLSLAEPFWDINGNDQWDLGEPFVDPNGNGLWDDDEVWTYTCTAIVESGFTSTAIVTATALLDPDCAVSAAATLTVEPTTSCPGDFDCSDAVGFHDLIMLLGRWGPCAGCPQDLDGDGAVTLADLIQLLERWGACAAPGACCLPDGLCAELTEGDCAAEDGVFQGAGVPCDSVVCPQPACSINGQCAPDEYCQKPPGQCTGPGVCAPRPELCILIWDPVCGCDGVTYSNACFAAMAGVNVAYGGECGGD